MKTLGTHQANFTWARNQYNKSDDPEEQAKFARYMAKYLAEGKKDSFTTEQVTHGISYPAEVDKNLFDTDTEATSLISDEQKEKQVIESVDTNDVLRIGEGAASVYAYGYACCPDRLKIGCATGDVVLRIADQIFTSTPDKPALRLEIKTNEQRSLERALHAILKVRGRKIQGGGDEWFAVTRAELVAIYEFITASN